MYRYTCISIFEAFGLKTASRSASETSSRPPRKPATSPQRRGAAALVLRRRFTATNLDKPSSRVGKECSPIQKRQHLLEDEQSQKLR